jgi:hypothetical protein
MEVALGEKNAALAEGLCASTARATELALERALADMGFPMDDAVLAAEVRKVLLPIVSQRYDAPLNGLQDHAAFGVHRAAVVAEMAAAVQVKNVEALKMVFSSPLAVARRRAVAAASEYSNPITYSTHTHTTNRQHTHTHTHMCKRASRLLSAPFHLTYAFSSHIRARIRPTIESERERERERERELPNLHART